MVQSDVLPTYIAIVGSITYCLTNDTIFTRVQRYFYLPTNRKGVAQRIDTDCGLWPKGSHPSTVVPDSPVPAYM